METANTSAIADAAPATAVGTQSEWQRWVVPASGGVDKRPVGEEELRTKGGRWHGEEQIQGQMHQFSL